MKIPRFGLGVALTILLGASIVGCAGIAKPSTALKPSFNINGDWKYTTPGSSSPIEEAILAIKQNNGDIVGYWKSNSGICKEGTKWFEGKIKDDQVIGVKYLCTSPEIVRLYLKIENPGTLFIDVNIFGNYTTGKLEKVQ